MYDLKHFIQNLLNLEQNYHILFELLCYEEYGNSMYK